MAGRGRRLRVGQVAALVLLASLALAPRRATVAVQPGGLCRRRSPPRPPATCWSGAGRASRRRADRQAAHARGRAGRRRRSATAAASVDHASRRPAPSVRGLTIRGSGTSLERMDCGRLRRARRPTGAIVEDNRIEGNLDRRSTCTAPHDAVARGNTDRRPHGRLTLNERGNGVSALERAGRAGRGQRRQLRAATASSSSTSKHNVFRGNRFRDLRFAVHYMYTNDSEVSGNVSVGNHVGYAIMYSHRLTVRGNVSDGDRDHGHLHRSTARGTGSSVRLSRGQTLVPRAAGREMRLHLQRQQEPVRAATGSRAARSASTSRPAPSAT